MIAAAARLRVAVVVTAVGMGGCAGGPSAAPTASPAVTAASSPTPGFGGPLDPSDQAMLDLLPACPDVPPDADLDVPNGVVLPPDAVVTARTDDGALTQLEVWVPTDPVRIRRFYQQGVLGRAKPLQVEDEVIEAEALLEFPGGRFYVKAQALCPTASLMVVVASNGNHAVPTPTGTPDDPAG